MKKWSGGRALQDGRGIMNKTGRKEREVVGQMRAVKEGGKVDESPAR